MTVCPWKCEAGPHLPLSNRLAWAGRCRGSSPDRALAGFARRDGREAPRPGTPLIGSGFAIEMWTVEALEAVAVKACRAPIDSGWASG